MVKVMQDRQLVHPWSACQPQNQLFRYTGSKLFRVLDDAVVEVRGAYLNVEAVVCDAVSSVLSDAERGRAAGFRFAQHRQSYLFARAGLRLLLGERLGVEPAAVELVETSYGKPRLGPMHEATGLEFNLSHSGSLVLYAFTRGATVGIDCEEIRDVPDADQLAARFFSATEAAALRALPADRRQLAFLACWTRKEAFVKALGQGLSHPLDSFDVSIDPDTPARITRIGPRSEACFSGTITSFRPCPRYIAAVVRIPLSK